MKEITAIYTNIWWGKKNKAFISKKCTESFWSLLKLFGGHWGFLCLFLVTNVFYFYTVFMHFLYENKFLKENADLSTLTILKTFCKQDICLFKLCIGAPLLYNATEKLNPIIYIRARIWLKGLLAIKFKIKLFKGKNCLSWTFPENFDGVIFIDKEDMSIWTLVQNLFLNMTSWTLVIMFSHQQCPLDTFIWWRGTSFCVKNVPLS